MAISNSDLQFEFQSFVKHAKNWQSTAILESNQLHGNVHHPTKFQANNWNL